MSGLLRQDLVGKPVMFLIGHSDNRWHRTPRYGVGAVCTCPHPLVMWRADQARRVAGLDEDAWKFAAPEEFAPCTQDLATKPVDAGPWAPTVGERVMFKPEAAANYEAGGKYEWFSQRVLTEREAHDAYKSNRDGAQFIPAGPLTLCVLRDRRTGTEVFAPIDWIRPYEEAPPSMASTPYGTVVTHVVPRVPRRDPDHHETRPVEYTGSTVVGSAPPRDPLQDLIGALAALPLGSGDADVVAATIMLWARAHAKK